MDNKKKIRLGWLAFSFVIFHFGAILLTTFPENYSSKRAKTIANYYVKPLFTQTWSMFAPCPTTAHTLRFRLNYDNDTTDLITPSEYTHQQHSLYRFTHHGDLATGEYNLLYWIKLDLIDCHITPNQNVSSSAQYEFKKTTGYFLLKNYLNGYSNNLKQTKPNSAYVELDYFNIEDNTLDKYTFTNLQ